MLAGSGRRRAASQHAILCCVRGALLRPLSRTRVSLVPKPRPHGVPSTPIATAGQSASSEDIKKLRENTSPAEKKRGGKQGPLTWAEQTELQQAGPHVQIPIWVPISVQVPVWSYRPDRGPIRGPRNFTVVCALPRGSQQQLAQALVGY